MLTITISLYFFLETTVLYRPKLTFYPLEFFNFYQILKHSVELFLANFSDMGNVRNKTSIFLTNFLHHCTVKGPKYIADIFLCRPLKRNTKREDTLLQLMLRCTRLISKKKTCVQICRYPEKQYHSHSNLVQNIAPSELYKHTSKIGNLSKHHIKGVCIFVTSVNAFCVC